MTLTNPNQAPLFGEEPDDDSFWLKMVSECLDNPVTKLPNGKRLLVLGDNDSQKTVLVSKLQGASTPDVVANFTKGNGLEYKYLSVKDEYCDNQTKLGVWILDGDPFYKPLLKYALGRESLANTTVMLVASMTKPWDIFETILSWTELLKDHIASLGLSEAELEERKLKVLERFREYIEPGLSIYGSLAADNTRELQVNLGVEIIVVVTRTEYMKELRTEFGYEEEHFDFLQFTLREFCLAHGAALFYVSVKEDRNCDFLLKYLLHKIYSFPFRIPGVLVEPDSVIVPAGWDTKNKIKFFSDGMPTIPISTPFEDVVFRPARLSDKKRIAPEVVAQRDQEFLADLQSAMDRQASDDRATDVAKESSSMTATVVQRNVARRMTRAQPGGRSPQKKIEAKIAEGDNTLSNFFHSLLNRRTSAPVDRPVGLSGGRTFVPKTAHENAAGAQSGNISNTDYAQSKTAGFGSTTRGSAHSAFRLDQESLEERVEAETAEGSPNAARNRSTAHMSLDQDDKEEAHPLPEYFMSSSEAGLCDSDCSFPKDPNATSFDMEDCFSPPLDRVKSSFNPPLKLLLERPEEVLLPNGRMMKSGNAAAFSNGNATLTNGNGHSAGDAAADAVKEDSVLSSLPCRMSGQDQSCLGEE